MLKPLSGIVGALTIMLLVGPSWAGDRNLAQLMADRLEERVSTSAKEKALEEILLSLDGIRAACEELEKASNSEGGPEDTVVAELVGRVIPAVRGASTQTTNALRKLKVRSKRNNVKILSGGEKRFHADKVESSEEIKSIIAAKVESSEKRKSFHAAKVESSEERKRFHADKVESKDPMER
jgi:hypothetical protein